MHCDIHDSSHIQHYRTAHCGTWLIISVSICTACMLRNQNACVAMQAMLPKQLLSSKAHMLNSTRSLGNRVASAAVGSWSSTEQSADVT